MYSTLHTSSETELTQATKSWRRKLQSSILKHQVFLNTLSVPTAKTKAYRAFLGVMSQRDLHPCANDTK